MPILHTSIEEIQDGEYIETDLEIEFNYTPYIPAKTYGRPEDCHPAEGGDVEILEIWETVVHVSDNKCVSNRRVRLRDGLMALEGTDTWERWCEEAAIQEEELLMSCDYFEGNEDYEGLEEYPGDLINPKS
jgi:hypothetical protein